MTVSQVHVSTHAFSLATFLLNSEAINVAHQDNQLAWVLIKLNHLPYAFGVGVEAVVPVQCRCNNVLPNLFSLGYYSLKLGYLLPVMVIFTNNGFIASLWF